MLRSPFMLRVAASLSVVAMLAACQQADGRPDPYVNKTNIGTVAGAALGGLAGHNIGSGSGQVVATIAGTLIGAGLGREVGGSLDRADIAYHDRTAQRALETAQPGQALPWSNPESGARGTITPSNYYQTSGGQYCREYNQTITVGGKTERGYGTACRQADGSWQIVE
jgi:surface antigen